VLAAHSCERSSADPQVRTARGTTASRFTERDWWSDETRLRSNAVSDLVSVLFGREEIRRRIEELGRTITGDYEGRAPVLISVLKGGSLFLGDLIREINLPLSIDYMSISRYGGAAESRGRVRIVKDLDQDIGGRDVIVVEDIVDTGLTLGYLMSVLESRSPISMRVCALLDKTARRIAPLEIRYRGFECPDVFVVGYGLDFRERYRNIPDLLAVQDMAALEVDPDLLLPYLPRGGGAGG
jgi:hypoxanthine phosphoribosyltransferase